MKIYVKRVLCEEHTYPSIEDYAEDKLASSDYYTGALADTADTATNNSRAIGRLLDVLASKGIFNVVDVAQVIEYDYEESDIFDFE